MRSHSIKYCCIYRDLCRIMYMSHAKYPSVQVIAVICVLVWVINIPRFADPVHGNWVSIFATFCSTLP